MANVFNFITGAEHVVAESTKLRSTRRGGGHMANIKMVSDMDNGCLVSLGEYVEDEVYKAIAPVAGAPVYLILTPPLAYNNERKFYENEQYFYNAQGEIARGYQIFADDFFAVSLKAFATTRTPVKGDFVSYSHATKLYTASTAKGNSGFVGQVSNVINRDNRTMVEIHVVAPSIGTGIDGSYAVTATLTHLTSDAPAITYAGDTLVVTLAGTTGYTAPTAITSVTMGGTSLVADTSYTYADGVITVPNVSGAVVITATGASI